MNPLPQDPNQSGNAGAADKDRAVVTLTAPNGATITEAFHPNQKVKVLLAAGVKSFADSKTLDPSVPYDLVKGQLVLSPDLSLEDAGVVAGDTLKIRSRAIPQDGSCIRS